MPEFKDRLKELFDTLSLSQVSLAKLTGIGRSSLSIYLSGKKIPTITVVQKISIVTGVKLDWLLLGEGSMFRAGAAAPSPPPSVTLPADLPKEQLIQWINDFWQHTDQEGRTWLLYEVKRHFPEFVEWLKTKETK